MYKTDEISKTYIVIYILGIIGVLMVPFFSMENGRDEDCGDEGKERGGIFWYGDYSYAWERFGVNVVGVLAITAWSLLWSGIIFGSLKYFNFLRIDRDTEFRGNDLVKHGESAYPVDAWAELQYEKRHNATTNVAPNMQGSAHSGSQNKGFNNAFEMVPTTGKLFGELAKNYSGFEGDLSH